MNFSCFKRENQDRTFSERVIDRYLNKAERVKFLKILF